MIDKVINLVFMKVYADCASGTPAANEVCGTSLPNNKIVTNADAKNILAIVFATIGALALLVIVIAGLRYIGAAGDPQKTAQARNTIVYALIGLIFAITAEALVAFVVGRV